MERCHVCFHKLTWCSCVRHLWDEELQALFGGFDRWLTENEMSGAEYIHRWLDDPEPAEAIVIFPHGDMILMDVDCTGCESCDEARARLGLT